jgi:hypothetical protein
VKARIGRRSGPAEALAPAGLRIQKFRGIDHQRASRGNDLAMSRIRTELFAENAGSWPRWGDPIEVTRVIHRGRRNWLFEGRARGERYALKLANVKSRRGAFASVRAGSETLVNNSVRSDDFVAARKAANAVFLGESYHACDDLVLRQLLYSEYATLTRVGARWNSGVVGITPWTSDTPSRTCLVLPYYEERPIAAFPEQGRWEVWLACLPNLWTLLEAGRHGDLNPNNVLLSADRRSLRLIDPCSVCASVSSDAAFLPYRRDVFFMTTAAFYPLHPPFDLERNPDVAAFIASLETEVTGIEGAHFRREATFRNDQKRGSKPLPVVDFGGEELPSAADRCAMGLIAYYLLTGKTLMVPDLVKEPVWAYNFFSRTMTFPEDKRTTVDRAVSAGYLRDKLAKLDKPAAAKVIEGLITLRVSRRDELEALVREAVPGELVPAEPVPAVEAEADRVLKW